MSVPTGTAVPGTAGRLTTSRISGLRRASFAAFVMLVVQFTLGSYVNLYVTVPSADHGHGFGRQSPMALPGSPCTSWWGCC